MVFRISVLRSAFVILEHHDGLFGFQFFGLCLLFSVTMVSGSFLPSMIPRDTLFVFFLSLFLFGPSVVGWMDMAVVSF
jgi:hypothetical protein